MSTLFPDYSINSYMGILRRIYRLILLFYKSILLWASGSSLFLLPYPILRRHNRFANNCI